MRTITNAKLIPGRIFPHSVSLEKNRPRTEAMYTATCTLSMRTVLQTTVYLDDDIAEL